MTTNSEPCMRNIRSSNIKLEAFRDKIHLSVEEEIEKKRIQKLKLASKDKMMEILHRHHAHHEAH